MARTPILHIPNVSQISCRLFVGLDSFFAPQPVAQKRSDESRKVHLCDKTVNFVLINCQSGRLEAKFNSGNAEFLRLGN